MSAADNAKRALSAKKQKREEDKKKELKWLFGGVTESQVDIILYITIGLLAIFFAYTRVDWDKHLNSVPLSSRLVANPAATGSAPGSIPAEVTGFGSVKSALQSLKMTNGSLVLLHSELLDGTQLVDPNPSIKGSGIVGSRPTITAPQDVLQAIYSGSIAHVLWILPEWSMVSFSEDRLQCTVGPLIASPEQLAVSCPDEYFGFRRVLAPIEAIDANKAKVFDFQALTDDALGRSRVTAFLNKEFAVHVDLSYASKRDLTGRLLQDAGVDRDIRVAMKAFVSPGQFCFPDKDQVYAGTEGVLRGLDAAIGSKKFALGQPLEFYRSAVKDAYPFFCDGNGDKHFQNFRAIYDTGLNATQQRILRAAGMVAGVGVSVATEGAQLEAGFERLLAIVTSLNWPLSTSSCKGVSVTDEWLMRAVSGGVGEAMAAFPKRLTAAAAAAGLVESGDSLAAASGWVEELPSSAFSLGYKPVAPKKAKRA